MNFLQKMRKGADDTRQGVTKGLNRGNEIVNTLSEQVNAGTQAYKDEIMKKKSALQAQIQNTIPKGNFSLEPTELLGKTKKFFTPEGQETERDTNVPTVTAGGKSRKRRKRRRKRKTKRRGKSKNKRTRKHRKKRKRKRGGKSRRRK